mmetsp:Transcript_32112/g.45659  ORF Transcript_32112/g.45659 Transcript_32112/m.45659 type:complete len:126 (+) Transcript_32112:224-601(+)
MMMTVMDLAGFCSRLRWPEIIPSIASCTRASLSASRALVASSSKRTLGFLTKALAMAILCRCPPLSCTPRSPISVSYPSGRLSMKPSAFASLAASIISSCDGSSSEPSKPYIMFRFTDRAKSVGS